MYHCSCQDKDNLCKHIHKIHSFRVRSFQAPRFTTTESQDGTEVDPDDDDPLHFHHTEIADEDYEEKYSEVKLQRSFRALEKIATHLNNENVRSVGLSHICAVLKQLNLECEAMKNIEKIEQGKFEESEELPPNTKLKLQF